MTSKKNQAFDCLDIERLSQKYIDGKLSSQENLLFEEHLDYCLPCDKKIQFELRLKKIILSKGKESLSREEVNKRLKNIINNLS